jgi:hypothetical protein
MVDIEITNYESIAHTTLHIEGFTTLIGRNYFGKSAVLRAINAALTNKEGTNFISWGQTFCEVHLKFPDLDVLWHKEEGNNFYRINGKDYTKIGKEDPPQELLDVGFKPITVGDQKINLNYAVQFFPLFLVDKRDSKSADLLTSVYGLDRIYKAIDLCNKDQRTNSDLLRVREKDLKLVETGLEKYRLFPTITDKIPGIKNKKKELEINELEIRRIQSWNTSLKSLTISTRKLKPIEGVSIPDAAGIASDILSYRSVVKYNYDLEQLMSFLKKVKPIQGISLPEKNISDIKVLFSEYQRVLVWSSSYKKLSNEVLRLETIQKVDLPTSDIDIKDIPNLQRLSSQLTSLSQEYKNIRAAIDWHTIEIESMGTELKSFDTCPLCGVKRG